jgi:hypothetical protein
LKKHRWLPNRLIALGGRLAKFVLKSQLLTLWLALCALGSLVGSQSRPEPSSLPFEELFENMSVLSYRDAPSDSTARFVVELAAHGRVFRQYDIDERRFVAPIRGHDYRRSISGTRYPPLKVRGHVDRGFWLELPNSSTSSLLPDQFDELYRASLDYVKPVSAIAVVVGTLSGYSVGYRFATWSSSLSNPAVQERVLNTPAIGRVIAREAWRRVLLEPVVMGYESDAARFASVRGTQRIYTNFFRLALDDSNAFIPHEVARLDSAGSIRESRTMGAFARAVGHASRDSCDLSSADFSAIEDWASLLDRYGHWAHSATPKPVDERRQYFGMLAWYGLAPAVADEPRIWVGPRLLVRVGDTEGFVADEIPSSRLGCPIAWRDWLQDDQLHLGANAWTAQWMGELRQFAPIVKMGRGIARFWTGTG